MSYTQCEDMSSLPFATGLLVSAGVLCVTVSL